MFPAGLSGLALALLRASAAVLLIGGVLNSAAVAAWISAGAGVLALAMILGLCTRIAAGLCAFAAAVVCLRVEGLSRLAISAHGLTAVALSMLGPGAYSLDARLFGRRVIDLDS